MHIAVVIPTIRNLSFLSAWGQAFADCHMVIVEDHTTREIQTLKKNQYHRVSHYTWADIRNDFGKDEWIFSRQNAGIRSYGFWKAYEEGADVIITLDDDCYPVDKNFVSHHCQNLARRTPRKWTTTFPHPDYVFTRGIPYDVRDIHPVGISHGLWSNQIDLDGITHKKHKVLNCPSYPPLLTFIPHGVYFPMCSMNLAFTRQMTPLLYFPLMGKDPKGNLWGFDRFDDIWAGIFAKKIMDHLDVAVVNGSPFVEHRKASDPDINIQKEHTGLPINEQIWQWTDGVVLTKQTPAECYRELAEKISFPDMPYFTALRNAMRIWATLF